uniref:Alpha-mannosidase n=1 Tax=Bursaphelenchus xylophilus TaxID=6326 RepID=A0A1I7S5U6_BURXY
MNSAMASTLGLPFTPSWLPAVFDNKNIDDKMTLTERYSNLLTELSTIQGFRKAAESETAIFREKFEESFADLPRIAAKSSLVFVNSLDFLDFPRPKSSRIVNIGGIGVENSDEKLPEDLRTLSEEHEKIIYFSMGTMAVTTFNFMENILDIFSQVEGFHFVVRLDEKDTASREFAGNFPNIDVVSWIPQQQLICHPHVKLFITHGGYNSLVEAAYCGVPVLVIPLFGDQTFNGKLVERNGWGKMVNKDDLAGNPTKFIKIFSEMLRNNKYSVNAQRVKTLFKNQSFTGKEALQRYFRFLEAADGNLPEFLPSSVEMSIVQLYNLDLTGLLALVVLFLTFFIYNSAKITSLSKSSKFPVAGLVHVMAINLPSARLAFVAGLATFICISFVLYNFVDSNATIRTNALKRNIDSIETLRAKVNDLEAKLLRNEDLVKDFKGRLGRYQEIGKAHEAVENDNGQGAQIPQPQENNGVHVGFNVSGAQQCPVGQVVSDIQMLDVYDSIPFDNPNGGVWKQGFEIKYDKEKIKSEKRLDVIVIPHSHCDPGWLKTFEGYYEEQTKNILDGMAKNLGEKPDMKFIYAEMSFFELWWSQQTEDTKEKVRGYLQSGQFEIVTGGWVMTDEANAHLYSILMELFEGHEFLQTQLGFKPRSHWSIDPFGLSSVLAHVMKSANLTHMAVQRVHYSIKKYLAERKQLEFRWRQLFAGNSARTDIRTHMFPFYSYDVPHTCGPDPSICCQFDFRRLTSYGCPWGKPPKRITNTNVAARAEILADQYRKKAQLYDLNVLLIPLGDDFRYDTQTEWTDQYENYQKLFAYMNGKKELNINAKFGTLNDYFQLMDKRLSEQPETPKQDLPILSGDFFTYADRDDHYWSGYFTSRPFYKHMDRTVGHFVRAADILFSFSNWKATKNNEENASLKQLYNRLVEARRALSLFQHHDGVTGTARKDVVVDYGRKMLKAIEDSKTIISQATAYLFGLSEQDKQQVKVDTEHFLDLLPKHKPIEPVSTILIQNSLGFERNEVHCIAVKSPKIKIRKSESSEVPKQQIQPIIIVKDGKITIEKDQLELCFVANIPALGISRYELVQGEDNANFVKIQASEGVETSNFSPFEATKFDGEILLSNEKTSASFDSNTALLKSVKPKDDISLDMNMEFVFYGARGKNRSRDPGGDSLSGAYLFLPNGKAKPLENNKNSFVKVSGPIRQSIHILGPQEAQILQEIRLDQNEDFLDIINHVDITTQSNFEVAMRLKSTDFTNNEEFYTELNAQQGPTAKTGR